MERSHARTTAPVPNTVLEVLAKTRLAPAERRVLDAILRYTLGEGKQAGHLAGVMLVSATGLSASEVSRALKPLYERNILYKIGHRIGFQLDPGKWREVGSPSSPQQDTSPQLSLLDHEQKLTKSSIPEPETKEHEQKLTKSSISPRKRKAKPGADPRVAVILKTIEDESGMPIVSYGKEGKAVKKALELGFTEEQFLGCWRTMRNFQFWKGQYLPLWKVVENVAFYAKGELRDGRTNGQQHQSKRAMAGHDPSEYGSSWRTTD